MSTVNETSANFNFTPYFGNDSLSYDNLYSPFQPLDSTRAQLNFLVGSDGTTQPQQFQGSFPTPVVGAGNTEYGEERFQNDSNDDIFENADLSSETESQNLYSQRNSVDEPMNIDRLSTTTEEAFLLSTLPSSLENLSTALDGFATTLGKLPDAFTGTLTVVENLAATVSRVSTTFDSLDAKVDSLHQKIDELFRMMDEIIKRERFAI